MTSDMEDVWFGIASLGNLLSIIGLVTFIIGSTREREVRTSDADLVIPPAAAILGFVAIGYSFGYADGNTWLGWQGFGLADDALTSVRLASEVTMVGLVALGALGGAVERSTRAAQVGVGAIIGTLALPLLVRSADVGLLSDVSVDGQTFVDPAALASRYLLLGLMGLVGALIIGPRLGKLGPTGESRYVPGRSEAASTVAGLLIATATIVATAGRLVAVRPATSTITIGLIAASGGLLAAVVTGYFYAGRTEGWALARSLVGGSIASTAAAATMSPLWAAVVGAVGGVLVFVADRALDSARIDDPAGIFAMFGLPSAWGLLAVTMTSPDRGLDQLAAQMSGTLIVASWAVVISAVSFGAARMLGVLRIGDVEEREGLSPSG
ncbi:MAG: hypothetical protein HKN94_07840 [Acidimicrobiales bacterium]|nr:hypothetical protein [Acidimicrobiales bacterium]RZV48388.1 MAG: hypothetical protein EX269_01915 [Acidimicrobiales bacterium]